MKSDFSRKSTGIGPAVALLAALQLASCAATGSTQSINDVSTDATENAQVLAVPETDLLDSSGMFTERDLEQTADLSDAVVLSMSDGVDVLIDEAGVYVLSGDVRDAVIIVDADDEAKVQLVLDELSIINEDSPAIYVKSADKVFITTTISENYLSVTGEYEKDGDTNLDAAIFSRSDLVLNGTGTLEVFSEEGNGISTKDDLKITGGTLVVDADDDGLEANDSIRIHDGVISIVAGADALHSENDEDASSGYIYIQGGMLNILAADDGIRGNSVVQIDGGIINIERCVEGIEATQIQINGGTFVIYSTDDGINATRKVSLDVIIEVYGGDITITMASGDTDAFDSNGDLFLYGGTFDISAGSSFDANGIAQLIDGSVTINGTKVTELPVSRGGPGGRTRGR